MNRSVSWGCAHHFEPHTRAHRQCYNTPLHDDHCGDDLLFSQARFYAHRDEISFCRNPHPIVLRYDDSFVEGIGYTELQADSEILSGLQTLHMPGHTVGTLSVVVKTGE